MLEFRGFCGVPPTMFYAGFCMSIYRKYGGGIPTKPTKVITLLDTLCIGLALNKKTPPE